MPLHPKDRFACPSHDRLCELQTEIDYWMGYIKALTDLETQNLGRFSPLKQAAGAKLKTAIEKAKAIRDGRGRVSP